MGKVGKEGQRCRKNKDTEIRGSSILIDLGMGGEQEKLSNGRVNMCALEKGGLCCTRFLFM